MPIRLFAALRRLYWRLARPTTLGARVLVHREGQVLLVRHTYEPWWYLPGGGVRKGESFEDAARRELREETGLLVDDLSLFHVYFSQAESKNDHIALFVGVIQDGRVVVNSSEIAEAALHPMNALPERTSPATRRRISEYLGGSISGQW